MCVCVYVCVCVCMCVFMCVCVCVCVCVNQKLSVVPGVLEHSFCLQGKEYELKKSEKRSFLLKKVAEHTVNQVGEVFREILVARKACCVGNEMKDETVGFKCNWYLVVLIRE